MARADRDRPHLNIEDLPDYYKDMVAAMIAAISIIISLMDYLIWKSIFNPVPY